MTWRSTLTFDVDLGKCFFDLRSLGELDYRQDAWPFVLGKFETIECLSEFSDLPANFFYLLPEFIFLAVRKRLAILVDACEGTVALADTIECMHVNA